MSTRPTLLFIPGLRADHRLFKYQTAAFPNSHFTDLIDPLPKESLEHYAIRFAEVIRAELNTRPPAPIVVCGLSFGGMIAPYVARELGASGCILLAAVRPHDQFPYRYYLDWLVMSLCPPLRPLRLFLTRLGARFMLRFPRLWKWFLHPRAVRTYAEMPLSRLAGLSRMMFDWAYRHRLPKESRATIFDKPTLHIHGTNDWLLPIRRLNPDIIIDGGGHLLTITHPTKINEEITHFIEELRQEWRDPFAG
jgi:pimeloyl-ACP methyl ester carboxylesterase